MFSQMNSALSIARHHQRFWSYDLTVLYKSVYYYYCYYNIVLVMDIKLLLLSSLLWWWLWSLLVLVGMTNLLLNLTLIHVHFMRTSGICWQVRTCWFFLYLLTLPLPTEYVKRGLWNAKHPTVRLSILLLDNSTSVWQVCCWAHCRQEMSVSSRWLWSAGNAGMSAEGRGWTQTGLYCACGWIIVVYEVSS